MVPITNGGKRRFLLFLLVLLVHVSSNILLAQEDSAAYRAATSIPNSNEKINALEEFTSKFPASKLKTRAYDALFDLYVSRQNEQGALRAAHNSLQTLAPGNRTNAYNRFAWNLALNGVGLDSALVYIDRAIAMVGKARSLAGFQDTKAYVLYKLGRFEEAEALQRIAIQDHETDQEFLGHLAMFEKANNKLPQALRTMSKALYFDGEQDLKRMFLEWIAAAEPDREKQDALKKSVIMETVHALTETLKGTALVSARVRAATLMADLAVELPTARQWAEAAVASLTKESSINDLTAFKQSLALVLAAQENYKDALTQLVEVEELVSPYEGRYWLVLGKTYERLGDTHKAIAAYMSGLVPRNDPLLRSSLEPVYASVYGSPDGIDAALDALRKVSAEIEPGRYGHPTTPSGKVVLAELFTGAECGPCVSSDKAFDALAEYYPRTAVAILEHHVHIPGPDPMTTNDAWERYNWYQGEGTPTVLIDGREMMVGGGPKTVTRNRLGVYRHAIRKYENEKPLARLSLSVNKEGDNIRVNILVEGARSAQRDEQPVLHVALVENSVDYTGANGIDKHAFVVRRMFDGAGGMPLPTVRGKKSYTKQVNIAEVEKSIMAYLDDPTGQPSWPAGRAFGGWRGRPETLDRSNLAIVAWVQDMSTKAVWQAAYRDVPASIGAK